MFPTASWFTCASLAIMVATAISAPAAESSGFTTIDSIAALRQRFACSDQKIRMKPGIYRVTEVSDDPQIVFPVTGSKNHFDLRGVTIELDTKLLADMHGRTHELFVYRVTRGTN